MWVETWEHKDVTEDGHLMTEDGEQGGVYPNGAVLFSYFTIQNSNLQKRFSHAGGDWVSFSFPRTDDGVVKGMTLHFDNKIQMKKYIDDFITGAMAGKP